MERNYNVTGSERKALVNKIAELTGKPPVYLGMPSVSFKVGAFEVSRTGILSWEEANNEEAKQLITDLAAAGFHAEDETAEEPQQEVTEQEIQQEAGEESTAEVDENTEESATDQSTEEDTDALTITVPDNLTDEQFALLERLVQGKETLLKHAFRAEALPITREDGQIGFPWFTASDGDHTNAYMIFLVRLMEFVKKAKRVTVHDEQVDNEKFAFRIFLIRLGMKGTEYKGARKILLENLSGNSAWRNGKPENRTNTAESEVSA